MAGKLGFTRGRAFCAGMVMLALQLLVLPGCGGSSSGATGGSDSTGGPAKAAGPTGASASPPGFSKKSEIASYGKESDPAELEQAAVVVEENLSARASGDFVTQCESLSAASVKKIEKLAGPIGKETCAEKIGGEAKKAPKALLENPMTEPIAALRIEGSKGFVLFHGQAGKDYAMPVERETNGEWKVASLTTTTIPLPKAGE